MGRPDPIQKPILTHIVFRIAIRTIQACIVSYRTWFMNINDTTCDSCHQAPVSYRESYDTYYNRFQSCIALHILLATNFFILFFYIFHIVHTQLVCFLLDFAPYSLMIIFMDISLYIKKDTDICISNNLLEVFTN